MYELLPNSNFLRKAKWLCRRHARIEKCIEKTLNALKGDPFHRNLKTHKVIAQYDGKRAKSSFVTNDIRIIWRFKKGALHLINLIDIGGHSGKRKVYK